MRGGSPQAMRRLETLAGAYRGGVGKVSSFGLAIAQDQLSNYLRLAPLLASCDVSVIMNREKLMKMASAVRTGGKGSVRRKHKAVHKTTTTDDKRLQNTLKRLGVNTIPGIEEVNIFKEETVIHFVNPKVQASIAANTWVVSGPSQTKKLEDLLPSIINQLGPDNLVNLKKIAEQYQRQEATRAAEEDDDVPELVEGETFEDAAKQESKTA